MTREMKIKLILLELELKLLALGLRSVRTDCEAAAVRRGLPK